MWKTDYYKVQHKEMVLNFVKKQAKKKFEGD